MLSDCFRFQISRCNSIWQVKDLIYLSLMGCLGFFWSVSPLCAGPRDPFAQLLLQAVVTSRAGLTSQLTRTSSSLQQKPRRHQWSVAAAPGWRRHTWSYLVSPRFTQSCKRRSLECAQQDPECAQRPRSARAAPAEPAWAGNVPVPRGFVVIPGRLLDSSVPRARHRRGDQPAPSSAACPCPKVTTLLSSLDGAAPGRSVPPPPALPWALGLV